MQGPHGVGFRVVQQYDYARSYAGKTNLVTGQPTTGERARPLQTLVWYPALKAGPRYAMPTTCAPKPPTRYSNKDPEAAIMHYRQALALDPTNQNAQRRLQALAAPVRSTP